jgi:hypothetical protein
MAAKPFVFLTASAAAKERSGESIGVDIVVQSN